MNRKLKTVLISFLFLALASVNTYANNMGWVIEDFDGNATLIDFDANKVIKNVQSDLLKSSTLLLEQDNTLSADVRSNLLFVIYDYPDRYAGQGVRVLNLNDITLKKDIGIISKEPDNYLPEIISPPSASDFYLIWWSEEQRESTGDGNVYDIYNKNNLDKIKTIAPLSLETYLPYWFSKDGSELYSIFSEGGELKIYNGVTLQLKNTVDFNRFWDSAADGKAAEYYRDNIVLVESFPDSNAETYHYNYFIYNVSTGSISNKIPVTEVGMGLLTADLKKLLIIESSSKVSRIHVYNVATGEKIKVIDLSNNFLQIHSMKGVTTDSQGEKIYLSGKSKKSDRVAFLVLNISLSDPLIASFPGVEGSWLFMLGQ